MTPAQAQYAQLWALLSQVENCIGLGLIKISICLCVLRVLDRVSRLLRACIWTLIVFVSVCHLAQVILFFVECFPLAKVWDASVKGTCLPLASIYTTAYVAFGKPRLNRSDSQLRNLAIAYTLFRISALDAFTDLVTALVPVLVILRLQMNTRTKLGLSILISLGACTAGCAIAKSILANGLWAPDVTWTAVTVVRWAVAEHLLGIILSSLPAMKPLFSEAVTALSTSSRQTTGTSSFNDRHITPKPRPPARKGSSNFSLSGRGQSLRADWEMGTAFGEKARKGSLNNYERLEREVLKRPRGINSEPCYPSVAQWAESMNRSEAERKKLGLGIGMA